MSNWLSVGEGVWSAILFILLYTYINPLTAWAYVFSVVIWKLNEIKSELSRKVIV